MGGEMDTRPNTDSGGIEGLSRYLSDGLIGHEHLIECLLIALLEGGHLLVEGRPGLPKHAL